LNDLYLAPFDIYLPVPFIWAVVVFFGLGFGQFPDLYFLPPAAWAGFYGPRAFPLSVLRHNSGLARADPGLFLSLSKGQMPPLRTCDRGALRPDRAGNPCFCPGSDRLNPFLNPLPVIWGSLYQPARDIHGYHPTFSADEKQRRLGFAFVARHAARQPYPRPLVRISDKNLEPDEIRQMIYAIMSEQQRSVFEENMEIDFAVTLQPGSALPCQRLYHAQRSGRRVPYHSVDRPDFG
jgi:hypothetical protein